MDFYFCGNGLLREAPEIAGLAPVEEYRDFDGGTVRLFDVPPEALAGCGDAGSLSLRQLYGTLPEGRFRAAERAFQVLHWRRTYRFCPKCGLQLERKSGGEMAMRCGRCAADYFPRIDAAVIVAIEHGGRLLLAERRGADGRAFFSLIAGFVEAGESLEEAVRREVREEVGLELSSLEYVRSQSWPFPSQLMVGFRAVAASGDIAPDGVEIKRAGWFAPDALPGNLPQPLSIARKLIEEWKSSC